MKYIIMAAGNGKRWGNYLGVKKQLIEIEGETLLDRTVRLLNEKEVYVVSHDFKIKNAINYRPTLKGYEIDRFLGNKDIWLNKDVTFLYGDVYYSEDAIKTIKEDKSKSFRYFGRSSEGKHAELFAIKINKDYTSKFYDICSKIREEQVIDRGLGWDTYLGLLGKDINMPVKELREYLAYSKLKNFTGIVDETDDFDTPLDYETFKKSIVFYFDKIWFGGAFKAVYFLIQKLYKDYNVRVVYKNSTGLRKDLLKDMEQYCPVIKLNGNIYCDQVINVNVIPLDKRIIANKHICWLHSEKNKPVKCDEIITVSKDDASKRDFKTRVIYNEIDSNIQELSNEYTVDNFDGLKLVMVCRISKEKGFENLKKMLPKNKKYKMYIVGDGNYLNEAKELFKNDNVEFVGEKLNPYPYIKWADYLLATSNRETWNLTITEALALGTPVITNELPVFREQDTIIYRDDIWDKEIPKVEYKDNKNYLNWGFEKYKSNHVKLKAPFKYFDKIAQVRRLKNEEFYVEKKRENELLRINEGFKITKNR